MCWVASTVVVWGTIWFMFAASAAVGVAIEVLGAGAVVVAGGFWSVVVVGVTVVVVGAMMIN